MQRRGTFLALAGLAMGMLPSCGGSPDSTTTTTFGASALRVTTVSGNGQKGTAAAPLETPLVFRVTDAAAHPVSSRTVQLTAIAGGGEVDPAQATTDADGTVATAWRVGNGLDQIVKASATDDAGVPSEAYAIANSDIRFDASWVTGSTFYRNLSEPVPHDGWIVESNHFLVFSEQTGRDERVVFAKIAEEHVADIERRMAIGGAEELGIRGDDRETKFKVYAGTDPRISGIWRGRRNSGIMVALPTVVGSPTGRLILKHEVVHMVELLLIGPDSFVAAAPPPWFAEGIAESFADHESYWCYPITTVTELDAWFATHRNPITITDDDEIGSRPCEYYAMFGLVLSFLLDPEGGGRTDIDVRDMYRDMAVHRDFDGAFERHLGRTVPDLRDDVHDLLREYLPRRRTTGR